MDAKTIEWIIFAPLIIGVLLISWWATTESHNRLNDPDDDRTLHLDQLPDKLALFAHGIYRVTIFRQSGNIHAEHVVTGTAQRALAVVMTTFRRAKIDAVHVSVNSAAELQIGRLYHDHRGSNEGKKVGKATIVLVEQMSPPHIPEAVKPPEPVAQSDSPEPSVTFEYVGITCDCGAHFDLPAEELHRERACEACGKDATLTGAQIAQVRQAAADARDEALARHRAGETDIQVERKSKLTEAGAGLTASNIKYEAAQEAVTRLGCLKPYAIPTIMSLMKDGMVEHPRAIATAYRKDGDQLSRDEKKALGIRANAFMSRRAFEELSEKGRANPLAAHETTLLRAMFAENRFNRLTSHGLPDDLARYVEGFKYDTLTRDCPFCSRVDGTVVPADEVAILPAADCQCETANYMISPKIDWLKNIE
jgi:hypothetical protein